MKKCVSALILISTLLQFTIAPVSSALGNTNLSDFETYVVKELENFNKEIDITDYVIRYKWTINESCDKFIELLENNPQIFFVSPQITTKLSGTVKQPKYTYVNIAYNFSKSQYPKKKAEFEAKAEKALKLVKKSMSSLEKALVLHDYLVLNTKYDIAKPKIGRRTSYDALVNELAVCLGYAMAYNYLLDRAGIEGKIVSSTAMDHAWNYVKIGKSWYHVDVTNDDPIMSGKIDNHGRVSHKLFLLSDSGIKKQGHKSWTTRNLPPASNTVYDEIFFRDVETRMVYLNGYWYYMKLDEKSPSYNENFSKSSSNEPYYATYGDVYRYSFSKNSLKKIHTIDSTWFLWGTEDKSSKSWWTGNYSSIDEYNGMLYYTDAKSIYSLNPKTLGSTLVFTPKNSVGYIYGMVMDGEKIIYNQKRSPKDANSLKSTTISKIT